ncbi:MAG: cell envelope biogenesis protein OmpA [Flavobacteriales bacterium]|nr:cell envelope biogenesis protein OmpA [Flavobacteriales bacterium]|tara:strand:+ start:4804 stop:5799 length:996 start_codon:yes stop_codon:yes gene_type:complete
MQNYIFLLLLTIITLPSCITPKIHNAINDDLNATKQSLINQEKKVLLLTSKLEEQSKNNKKLKYKINILQNDSTQNGTALKSLKSKYNDLSDTYDLLVSKNSRLIASKAKETKELLEKLEQSQIELFNQEDQLRILLDSIEHKRRHIDLMEDRLAARSKRVTDLENMINTKDSLVTELKKKISKALIGLEGDGLTIVQKNGKVYISLEEQLLFASGKYEINNTGVIALNKLATVLSFQDDLDIIVEGHTDSIPLSGKGLVKDNWDLSVMRATNVVKVLIKNPKLNPAQFTAAGKSEFTPISTNKTSVGRSSNRRIELILTPNLDDLFKLLE